MTFNTQTETRNLVISNGDKLEFEMTPEFISLLRQRYKLSCDDTVTDEHIKSFLEESLRSALAKEGF